MRWNYEMSVLGCRQEKKKVICFYPLTAQSNSTQSERETCFNVCSSHKRIPQFVSTNQIKSYKAFITEKTFNL